MKKITLSFDNGPDPEVTPQVLDILKKHKLASSFFVLGEKLRDKDRRMVCERAHAEGHLIGNHTYNHLIPFGTSSDPNIADREIGNTQKEIGTLSESTPLFRPAGAQGMLNETLFNPYAVEYLQTHGYTCVLWNAIPQDWDNTVGWVETALQQCDELDWPLFVIHDLPTGAMDQLDRFINLAKEREFNIVQDFPKDCVPIIAGRIVKPIDQYVTG